MMTPYCSNIHPVRTFEDILSFLEKETKNISREFPDEELFPLGLWFPEQALDEALKKENVNQLQRCLKKNNYKLVTMNAFPQSFFHGETIKEKVYQPDWSTEERLQYTFKCARLAEKLGLENITISTLSGGYRPGDDADKLERYFEHLGRWLHFAHDLHQDLDCHARLALEPEPFNTLQDADDAIDFWKKLQHYLAKQGFDRRGIESYLGICLDTCHLSVRFKNPWQEYEKLTTAGIPVHKIQVSVAPRWVSNGQMSLEDFFALDEPVYLHQTFGKDSEGGIHDFKDLSDAKNANLSCKEWRTHFHVPIHFGDHPHTTGSELIEFLNQLKKQLDVPLLEVETYSFDRLKSKAFPDKGQLEQSITEELRWLNEQLTTS